jgi:hypothetical protein
MKVFKCLCVVPLTYVHFIIIIKMLIGLSAYLLAGLAPVAAFECLVLPVFFFFRLRPSQFVGSGNYVIVSGCFNFVY